MSVFIVVVEEVVEVEGREVVKRRNEPGWRCRFFASGKEGLTSSFSRGLEVLVDALGSVEGRV